MSARRLAGHPEMGRPRPDRWPERYRFFPYGPSLIAYRADVRPIQIIRIARASWDSSRIVPSESPCEIVHAASGQAVQVSASRRGRVV